LKEWKVEDINTTSEELKSKSAKIIMKPTPITVGALDFLDDPNGVRIALFSNNNVFSWSGTYVFN
jgi:lactoylglutathione lyase